MDFIKNNKLTSFLGFSCLLMGMISVFSSSHANNKENKVVALNVVTASQNVPNQVPNQNDQKQLVSQSFNKDYSNNLKQNNLQNNVDNVAHDVVNVSSDSYSAKNKSMASSVHLIKDIDLNDLMKVESQKLLNDSNEELRARLKFNEPEDSLGASMPSVAKDLEQNFTPKSYVDYKVAKGDTFTSIFLKHGDTTKASLKAYEALRKANKSYASLKVGEVVKIYVKNGKIDKIEKKLSLGREATLTLNDDGTYKASVYEPKIIEKDKIVTGKISTCFSVEARRLGIPSDVIDQFVDLFSSKVSFRSSLRRGDVFSIKYTEKKTDNGLFLSAGSIKAASIINQGKFLSLVGYKGKSGKTSYFNEKGETAGNYMLRYPVKFTRVSSVFSDGRLHPILKTKRPHNGVDFAAPTGTPVRTVADGRVIFAGWNGGGGKTIKIQHSSKYKTAYLHLSKIAPNIKVGTYVSRGDYIGNVGTTGLSTGPHLHYSFYINDKYVDPLKIDLPSMPIGGDTIPSKYLKNAIAELKANTEKMMASRENDEPQA